MTKEKNCFTRLGLQLVAIVLTICGVWLLVFWPNKQDNTPTPDKGKEARIDETPAPSWSVDFRSDAQTQRKALEFVSGSIRDSQMTWSLNRVVGKELALEGSRIRTRQLVLEFRKKE